MHNTSNEFLMMIEPAQDLFDKEGIEDKLTERAQAVWDACTPSDWGYKGVHMAGHGLVSDNKDHTTPCGRTTHSLLVPYVKHWRKAIPAEEIAKLTEEYYEVEGAPGDDED